MSRKDAYQLGTALAQALAAAAELTSQQCEDRGDAIIALSTGLGGYYTELAPLLGSHPTIKPDDDSFVPTDFINPSSLALSGLLAATMMRTQSAKVLEQDDHKQKCRVGIVAEFGPNVVKAALDQVRKLGFPIEGYIARGILKMAERADAPPENISKEQAEAMIEQHVPIVGDRPTVQ